MSDAIDLAVAPVEEVSTRRFRRALGLLALLCAGGWAFGWLIAPALIRMAHDSASIPLLSNLMVGRESTPVEEYLGLWRHYRDGGTLALFLFLVAASPLAFSIPSVTGFMARSGSDGHERRTRAAYVLALFMFAACGSIQLLAFVHPVAYVYAITEDSWLEYGSFVVFGMAGLAFLRSGFAASGWSKTGLLAFGLGALFVALEEISWGQRIIGFQTPGSVQGYNAQGEVNFHNVWFPTHAAAGAALFGFGVLLPMLRTRLDSVDALLKRFGVPIPPRTLWPVFMVASLFLVLANAGVGYSKMDEISELALGFSLLILASHTAMRAGDVRWPAERISLPAAWTSLAVAALVTSGVVSWAPDSTGGLTMRLNNFAAHRYPDSGMPRKAATLFAYMETRPDLRTDRTRIDHGRILLSLGERAAAEEVLRNALRDQTADSRDTPSRSAHRLRNRAEIRSLMNELVLADTDLREALAIAEGSLALARGASDSIDALWSAAQTLALMDRGDGAMKHAGSACSLSGDLGFRRTVLAWARRLEYGAGDLPACSGP